MMAGLYTYPTWGLSLRPSSPLFCLVAVLNAPGQKIGRGCHRDLEQVISDNIRMGKKLAKKRTEFPKGKFLCIHA